MLNYTYEVINNDRSDGYNWSVVTYGLDGKMVDEGLHKDRESAMAWILWKDKMDSEGVMRFFYKK